MSLQVACGKKGFSLSGSKASSDINECLEYSRRGKHNKAVQCFESYKSRNYNYSNAAMADIAIADTHFAQKDYVLSAESYKGFIDTYPYHEKVPYAYYKAGVSYLKQGSKRIDRDQTTVDVAHQMLETVLKFYANTRYAELAKVFYDETRSRIARKNFYVGRYYYKSREYLAAIPRFQTVVTDYPRLGLDQQSFYYLIRSLRRTEQNELASKYLEIFRQYYPNSKLARKL